MTILGYRRGVVRLAYATFVLAATLAVNANAQTLPEGWTLSNIGSPAISGSATYSSGTFSVSGAGADIWSSSDQFTFVHQRLSGDATVIARVATLQNINAWSKAGVMIRESLAANSRYASVFVTPQNGVVFQRHSSTGGSTSLTNGGSGTAPVWLKLVRASNTLTASRSADGTTWSTIGSGTVSMGSTVYVGLAVTSHDRLANSGGYIHKRHHHSRRLWIAARRMDRERRRGTVADGVDAVCGRDLHARGRRRDRRPARRDDGPVPVRVSPDDRGRRHPGAGDVDREHEPVEQGGRDAARDTGHELRDGDHVHQRRRRSAPFSGA